MSLMVINPYVFAAPAPSGYSFTMTAGNFSGLLQGYSSGAGPLGAFGSIDQEPIPGQQLDTCASGIFDAITFVGDIVSALAGLTVWVDSVEYPFSSDWTYDAMQDRTVGTWTDPNGPVFVDTNEYFVEIKAAS